MGKICVACLNEKNGIKTIIPHSCGKTNVIAIGRNAGQKLKINQLMQSLDIAQKIRRCHEAVKGLYREEYKEVLKPYIEQIKNCMAENKKDEISACLKLSQECAETNPNAVMFLMAATIEIVEYEN